MYKTGATPPLAFFGSHLTRASECDVAFEWYRISFRKILVIYCICRCCKLNAEYRRPEYRKIIEYRKIFTVEYLPIKAVQLI